MSFLKRLLCFGYGYTARTLVNRLKPDAAWRFVGTTRSHDKAAEIAADGVSPIIWDGGAFPADEFDGVTHILVSAPPGPDGCPALAATGSLIAERASHIAWIGYLSTNGVYGDHGGAWVDEETPAGPTTERSRRRVAAENAWRALADQAGLSLIIFRLPGIYGPGRSALDTVRDGRAKRIFKEGQVFSRMHVDDIAAALESSIGNPQHAYDLFNLADDEPAPPQDVIEYACNLLGVKPPPLITLDQAGLSDMGRSFYADNKRISNKRMKDTLLPNLTYPTFREGLKAILSASG
ncbi:MAG: SDR family oxidoreductase [Pseudomonadota bacterium]